MPDDCFDWQAEDDRKRREAAQVKNAVEALIVCEVMAMQLNWCVVVPRRLPCAQVTLNFSKLVIKYLRKLDQTSVKN